LADRARALGWNEVEVIDEDLGCSGSGTHRRGFERLLGLLCNGEVGAEFRIDASPRLSAGRPEEPYVKISDNVAQST